MRRDELLDRLIDAEVPCKQCGYNLYGQRVGGRCPECDCPVSDSFQSWLERPKGSPELAKAARWMAVGWIVFPLGLIPARLGWTLHAASVIGYVPGMVGVYLIARDHYVHGRTVTSFLFIASAILYAVGLLVFALSGLRWLPGNLSGSWFGAPLTYLLVAMLTASFVAISQRFSQGAPRFFLVLAVVGIVSIAPMVWAVFSTQSALVTYFCCLSAGLALASPVSGATAWFCLARRYRWGGVEHIPRSS